MCGFRKGRASTAMMYDYFGPIVGFTARLRMAIGAVLLGVLIIVLTTKYYAGINLPQFAFELALALGVVLGIIIAIVWHSKTGHEED